MSGPKYVTAGGMRIDYLITHDGQAHVDLVGGNALYSAVGAALWSNRIGLWSRIGENYSSNLIRQLQQHGFITQGLIRVEGKHDHRTFYAYTADGRRDDTNPASHFARIGQSLPETLSDYVHSTPGQDDPLIFEPLALRPHDWPNDYHGVAPIHLAPLPIRSHLTALSHFRKLGIPQVTVDPGERYMIPQLLPYIRQILPNVDAFLPSDQEVCSLFGPEVDIEDAAVLLGKWGPKLVIIKCGSDGVLLYEKSKDRLTTFPAFYKPGDSHVVDITGAGDAFCGGFMVGLWLIGDPHTAVHMGTVSASLVIEGYGALYALKQSPDEAKKRLDRLASIK